ncbi:Hypothetical predicted protein, partial [Marmota monax]
MGCYYPATANALPLILLLSPQGHMEVFFLDAAACTAATACSATADTRHCCALETTCVICPHNCGCSHGCSTAPADPLTVATNHHHYHCRLHLEDCCRGDSRFGCTILGHQPRPGARVPAGLPLQEPLSGNSSWDLQVQCG